MHGGELFSLQDAFEAKIETLLFRMVLCSSRALPVIIDKYTSCFIP